MKYEVFLSYRRDGGFETAKHLHDLLTRDGYKVSFDIDTLRNGDFDKQLYSRIEDCKDFIIILDANAFTRTLDPTFPEKNDWMRNELAYAIQLNKNIIPIMLGGFEFPNNLPLDIVAIEKKNGPVYAKEYFETFYLKLRDFMISKPKKNIAMYCIITLLVAIPICIAVGIYIYNVFGVKGIEKTILTELCDEESQVDTLNTSQSKLNFTELSTVTMNSAATNEDVLSKATDKKEAEQPKPQTPLLSQKVVTSGTLNLNGGIYVGSIKNGKADGKGKMTYSSRTLISKYDSQKRYAEAGQYIEGTWKNGELNVGVLFNSDGSKIEVITIGVCD